MGISKFLTGFCTLLINGWAMAQPPLSLHRVSPHCYVYTTYRDLGSLKFPSNGMLVIDKGEALVIDTPWDTTQFQALLDSLAVFEAKPIAVVSTHFHDDRTAGLAYYRLKNIPTYSTAFTKILCDEKGEKQAAYTFSKDTLFKVGTLTVQTFYPGAGHSPDNIVLYVPEDKVLFGGCLVKSYESSSLGNLSDANTEEWPSSLQKVLAHFKDLAITIPGHQDWSQPHSIRKSLELLRIRPAKK